MQCNIYDSPHFLGYILQAMSYLVLTIVFKWTRRGYF